MDLDNSEFIARHHGNTHTAPIKPEKKADFAGLSVVIIFAVFSGIFFYIAAMSKADDLARTVASLALVASLAVGYMVFRIFRDYVRNQRELLLIKEVLEGSRGARLITDSAGTTVYTNQKFNQLCQTLGQPNLQSLSKLFETVPESGLHFKNLRQQAEKGLSDTAELFSRLDDREYWFTLNAQPVGSHAGYIHWRIDDVTQKHIVERAIREEREKLIDFTDNAPVGFFSVDENGRFVFANATFARWLGEDLRALLESCTLHTYLVDPPINGKPYDLVEDSRARQVVEVRMKGTGGKTFLASVNQAIVKENGVVRTRAVVHDLTAEREMRKALQASEDRFQRFFEEAPLGIVQLDKKRMIMDCNNAFGAMLGSGTGNIEGRQFKDFVTPDDRPRVMQILDCIERDEYVELPADITLVAPGTQAMTQMYAQRFSEGQNIVLHFIDVTEKKSLEEQFVQSQKMQAIGQLAGGVAHDFNNLLTAIIGFSDLLLLRHKPGDPSFADIMQIKQNSNRAANLVRQLLAFSRQQTLRPKVQDITDILTEVSHLLRRLIGASIDLDLIHGHDLGLVKVDEGQIEQVLINMAVNARDAMEGVGALKIETENHSNKKPRELVSEELPIGEWTLIKISDTGCGIPQDNIKRIFEPFFTTKEVGHGTGLGLATVYGIIRQTGGFLDVHSVVGKGTTFFIYLPRSTEVEAEDVKSVTPEDEPTRDLTGTERILLVEDEDAVRMFSQRALGNKGYEVLTADSGESALSLMESQTNKHLDLLVTDVVMPHMDGPTLAQRIRQHNPDLKVIFMSGYTEDKLKGYMGKNTYFLPKPFTLKGLASKVKEVLEE